MFNDADHAVAKIAGRQHCVVSRAQAIKAGLSRSAIGRRLVAGMLIEILPCVYAIAGVPASPLQRLMAAILWAGEGAVVSHRAACSIWDLDGFASAPVEISIVGRRNDPPKGIICHRVAALLPGEVTVRHGIPVTTPVRTLLDLGAVVGAGRVERAMHQMVRRGLVSVGRLERAVREASGRGRRGVGVLKGILKACGPAYVPPESELEAMVFALFRDSDLPMPASQYRILDENGEVVLRADFAFVGDWLIMPVDGYDIHSDREAPMGAGPTGRSGTRLSPSDGGIIVITYDDVCNRPQEILATVRQARARRQQAG